MAEQNTDTAKEQSPQLTALLERIERDFTYQPTNDAQVDRMAHLRGMAKAYAKEIAELVPASREQSLALTNLEQTVMWVNAGIARVG